jgi:hypothetical protein
MSLKRVKNVLVASMILFAAAFPDRGRAHPPAPPAKPLPAHARLAIR